MRKSIALIVLVTLTFLSGCNKPDKSTIIKSLYTTSKIATDFGLEKWYKTKPDGSVECAKTLMKNIDEVLLPYLNGGTLPTSTEVQTFLKSSLFKNVDPEIKDILKTASLALDAFLPVPSSESYLTADEIDYIKSFLSGVKDGCKQFLSDIKSNNNNAKTKELKVNKNARWLSD